jgi:uncharacterized protein (DUF342 family)
VEVKDALSAGGRERKTQQWMVKKGDVLARLIPPTAGTPGTNVLGQMLPAPPGPIVRLQVLEGTGYDEAACSYIALIDGLARFDGNSLEVRRHLVWEGDLRIHDKPIEFDGTVLIRGSMRDGARIQATGDIEVTGSVEGATLISTGGAVHIRQGVVGRGRGFISAKTNIDARHFENATAHAEGDITARHAVLHSRLTAGRYVRAELDKGAIFGGQIRAGSGVFAKTLGNAAGVSTQVAVGYDWATLSQLGEVEAALASMRQRAALCETIIEGFKRAKPNVAQLSVAERKALCTVLKRHIVLKARILQATERSRTLEAGAVQGVTGQVVCRENLYPGTQVKIGGTATLFSGLMGACTIAYNKESRRLIALGPTGRALPLNASAS